MSSQKKPQQSRFSVKICALLLGLCLTAGIGAGAASAEETVPNKLQNGSFEEEQTWTGSYKQPNQKDVPSWNTTATDGKIELFQENTGVYIKNVTLAPTDGSIAAELNAEEESTLYQNVKTSPSSIYEWGLDHGARNGTDTMALVIGPAQIVAPSKPGKDGRDQFMQMVDWLRDLYGEDALPVQAGTGPDRRVIVYSKKFAASGTFEDNAGNNAFSLTPSTIYTEEWHIWIIQDNRATSGANPWGSYGSNVEGTAGSADGSGSTEVDLSKYYLYTVPAGQTETLFGFVSVGYVNSSTTADKAKTFGNFLDSINFRLYHPLSGSTTAHGSAVVGGSDGTEEGESAAAGRPVTVDDTLATYITDGEALKIQAIIQSDDAEEGCEFVGVYYTKQDGDGNPVTSFLKLAGNEIVDTGSLTDEEKSEKWIRSTNTAGDIIYTYYLTDLTSPTDLHFVFIKSPTVTYDPNGGSAYVVNRIYNTDEAKNVYSYKPAALSDTETEASQTFISPYVSHEAESPNDGWRFVGWLLTGDTVDGVSADDQVNADQLDKLILPAVHTVACDYSLAGVNGDTKAQYFKIYEGDVPLEETITHKETGEESGVTWTDNGEKIAYANVHRGLTMVAQWRWRQAFIPQVNDEDSYEDSAVGGTVTINGAVEEQYGDNGGIACFAATNEIVTATAAANPGYTFEGWYDGDGNLLTTNAVYGYTETKESVNTCYARFSGSVTQKYIRQVGSGDHWEETADDTIGKLSRYSYTDVVGTAIISTAAAGDGYKFVGWYDEGRERVTDGVTLSYTTTGNAAYYARFSEKTDRPAENQVSASDCNVTYDGNAHCITVSGIIDNATPLDDIVYYSTDGIHWSTTLPARTNVQGRETIFVKVENPDYKTVIVRADITIVPRPVTITVDDAEKDYGEEDPGFTGRITLSDGSDGEALIHEDDLGTIRYSRSRAPGDESVGTYEDVLTASYAEDGNYTVTLIPGDFTIRPATVTGAAVIASGGSRVYDGQPFAASAEVAGAEGYTVYYKAGEGEWTTDAPSVTNVADGTVTVSVKAVKTGYTDLTCGDVAIAVTPRPITLTADSASKVYDGEALTKDSFTFTRPSAEAPNAGLVPGQDITAAVTGSQTETGTSRNVVSGAEIKAGDVDVTGNYDIHYVDGILSVTAPDEPIEPIEPDEPHVPDDPDDSDDSDDPDVPDIPPVSPGKPVLNTEDHYSYIIGYKDGTLRPYGTITRGEVATIFFRLLTDEAREASWSQTNDYADCDSQLWCNNAISTLSSMGIIHGFEDGTFRPYAKITRAQFAKIAVGFFETVKEDYEGFFTDVSAGAWYTEYVEAAARMGLIQGFEDGTFHPNSNITRAQACVIVNRALNRKPDEEHLLDEGRMLTWVDNNPGDWFYADMQEATNSHDYIWLTEEQEMMENWTAKLPQRDWAALEHAWSTAHSAPGGQVTR